MKWKILNQLSCFFILLCSYSHASTELQHLQYANRPADHLISLNFYQTDISLILQALADSQKMNLVMADDLSSKQAIKQTVKLNNVEWRKALFIILDVAKLEAKIDGNILFIKKNHDATIYAQQKWSAQEAKKLNSLSLKVNHADIKILHEAILQQGLLSERGKVAIDKRTNTIVITDFKEYFKNIQLFVKEFDKPLPQIHIAAHIVTMSHESLSELGVKWAYLGNSSQLLDKFDIGLGVINPTSSFGFNLAKRSGHLLNLELSALESENQLEIIASPNLLTSNQHTASIKQGTEIPYEVSNGNHGGTSIEFKKAVLGLEVTPKILSENRLMLDLYITQNTAGRSIKRSDGGESLAIDTQEIKTQVFVNHGETVILGGIFQQSTNQIIHNVPGANKIPLIGHLFNYKGKKQQRRELVIFITPQLVE